MVFQSLLSLTSCLEGWLNVFFSFLSHKNHQDIEQAFFKWKLLFAIFSRFPNLYKQGELVRYILDVPISDDLHLCSSLQRLEGKKWKIPWFCQYPTDHTSPEQKMFNPIQSTFEEECFNLETQIPKYPRTSYSVQCTYSSL